MFSKIQTGSTNWRSSSPLRSAQPSPHCVSIWLIFFFILGGAQQNIFRSNIIPLSSLCIHRGKSVWVLYVDATCINYDGNAFDATLLAMVAALKNSTCYIYIYPSCWSASLCPFCVSTPSPSHLWLWKEYYHLFQTSPQVASSIKPQLPYQRFIWYIRLVRSYIWTCFFIKSHLKHLFLRSHTENTS